MQYKVGLTGLATLLCFLVATVGSFAQEQMGLVHDNYAPVNGMILNPSAIVDQDVWLDINLVGADVYARNNFAFYPKTTLLKAASWAGTTPQYNLGRKNIKAHLDAEVLGPSASIAFGRHAVGLHTSVRAMANVRKVPGMLGQIAVTEAIPTQDATYIGRNGRFKTMGWGELGLTYGYMVKQYGRNQFNVAGTVKRLFGIYHADIITKYGEVNVVDQAGTLAALDGKYAYAQPNWKAGRGWGLNLGFTYKKMLEDVSGYLPYTKGAPCEKPDYKYKLGVSLVDAGYIRYKNNAQWGQFDQNTTIDDLNSLADPANIANDASIPQNGTKFTAATPTGLSGQFDYNFENHFYANATVVQKVTRPGFFGVERANVLSISGRYERKWFGASLPITMYDYTTPQIGLMLRMGPVIVGSDHITPFFWKQDLYAADIYAHLKIPIHRSPGCNEKSKGTPKSRGGQRKASPKKRNGIKLGNRGGRLKSKTPNDCPKW